jgi:heme exporter protein CcmD
MSAVLEVTQVAGGMSYAPYVIASYAVFLLVLAWDAVLPWLRHRRLLRQIQLKSRREATKQKSNE